MRSRRFCLSIGLAWVATVSAGRAQGLLDSVFEQLPLRSIGPAVMGGRIDDIAVVENRPWIF